MKWSGAGGWNNTLYFTTPLPPNARAFAVFCCLYRKKSALLTAFRQPEGQNTGPLPPQAEGGAYMRIYGIREEDGRCGPAAECELCGGEISRGQPHYRIHGQIICEDCLGDYARGLLAAWRCGEEDTW